MENKICVKALKDTVDFKKDDVFLATKEKVVDNNGAVIFYRVFLTDLIIVLKDSAFNSHFVKISSVEYMIKQMQPKGKARQGGMSSFVSMEDFFRDPLFRNPLTPQAPEKKPAVDWFGYLPNDLLSSAVKNLITQGHKTSELYQSLSETLKYSFNWIDTPEGPVFWAKVHTIAQFNETLPKYAIPKPYPAYPSKAKPTGDISGNGETASPKDLPCYCCVTNWIPNGEEITYVEEQDIVWYDESTMEIVVQCEDCNKEHRQAISPQDLDKRFALLKRTDVGYKEYQPVTGR